MNIGIIGTGLTGLVAAKELSNNGYSVDVFEQLPVPGGRMRTECIDGWSLDVGFQVLLTAYPYLNKHINFSDLQLTLLDAGATVYKSGKTTTIGDPFRTKNMLFSTLFSTIGSFRDKWLIFQLKRKTDRLSIDEIFESKQESSLEFLKRFGFSDRIIERFFLPFFSGIFLENELQTSSSILLFVFKMFATGNAAIPAHGIGEVGKQLVKNSTAQFHFDSEVTSIEKGQILLQNGEHHSFDLIINTIPPTRNHNNNQKWHGCHTYYFEHSSPRIINEPRIGLNANKNCIINNIFYPSSIAKPSNKKGKELLSLTVVNNQNLSDNELKSLVIQELSEDFGIEDVSYVHHYSIPFALPKLIQPKMATTFKIENGIIHVGDYLLNGSQNAACKIGEEVAAFILSKNRSNT